MSSSSSCWASSPPRHWRSKSQTCGITVNAVAPGIIATPMTAALFDAAAIERLVPLNRAGLPEEVAAVVAFLASEEASYVTAQIVSVSGGMA